MTVTTPAQRSPALHASRPKIAFPPGLKARIPCEEQGMEAPKRSVPLPYVDEHTTVVAAAPDTVWQALGEALDGAFSGPRAHCCTRLVGSADRTASGPRPPAEGSTFPGFRAVTAIPGEELVLRGRHRFSTYALTFRLDPAGPGRVLLRAETRAAFPGPAGTLYRLLVIRTGSHAVLTRRLLGSVRRRAERPYGVEPSGSPTRSPDRT